MISKNKIQKFLTFTKISYSFFVLFVQQLNFKMIRIAILASGSGTNAENIINYFKDNSKIKVVQVLSNKKDAKVLERAKRLKISNISFNKDDFYHTNTIVNYLKETADFIVLAGFLWKVPQSLLAAFPNKIVNIHPALLPKYGGKGMYGMHVHEAVVANKETETGITIHFVNENYDEGAIVFQAKTAVEPNDSPHDVAKKIHELEYKYFPSIIESVILKND